MGGDLPLEWNIRGDGSFENRHVWRLDSTRLDSAHLEKSAQQDESSMDQPHHRIYTLFTRAVVRFLGLVLLDIQVQK